MLIINNQTFAETSKLKERLGSEKDVERLKKTFESFRFTVQVERDKKALGMLEAIASFLKQDLDMLAIVIMSHGYNDMIAGVDGEAISITDDILPLLGNHNEHLRNIFKLVVVNACRYSR